jgi:signal peptidase II
MPKTGTEVRPIQPAAAGDVYLVGARQIDLVPDHLDLSYAENPNGAWGLLADLDASTRRALFFALSLLAIAAIGALIARPPDPGWATALALGGILGGALGNLIDRVRLAYVVDFIHMHWEAAWLPTWLVQDWPRYNVADIGITVGVVVLVLGSLFRKEQVVSRAS